MGYELRVSSIVLFPDLQSICELFAHPKFELPPVAVDGHLAVHLPDRSILQRLGPWGYPWLEVVESQVRSAAPCHVLKHSNENQRSSLQACNISCLPWPATISCHVSRYTWERFEGKILPDRKFYWTVWSERLSRRRAQNLKSVAEITWLRMQMQCLSLLLSLKVMISPQNLVFQKEFKQRIHPSLWCRRLVVWRYLKDGLVELVRWCITKQSHHLTSSYLIHIQFIYYSSPCLGRLKFSHASAEPQHSVWEMISSRNSKSHKLTANTYLQFTFISFFHTFCRLLCPSPWLAALVLHLQ